MQRVASWNRAAIMKHIWSLFTKVGSLWVAWIHANLLKGKCFWTLKIPLECTWSWRAILKLRDEVRKFIRFEVGMGNLYFFGMTFGILLGYWFKYLVLVSFMILQVILKLKWIMC